MIRFLVVITWLSVALATSSDSSGPSNRVLMNYRTDSHARYESGNPGENVNGHYTWRNGGKVFRVDYTADENGFRPVISVESDDVGIDESPEQQVGQQPLLVSADPPALVEEYKPSIAPPPAPAALPAPTPVQQDTVQFFPANNYDKPAWGDIVTQDAIIVEAAPDDSGYSKGSIVSSNTEPDAGLHYRAFLNELTKLEEERKSKYYYDLYGLVERTAEHSDPKLESYLRQLLEHELENVQKNQNSVAKERTYQEAEPAEVEEFMRQLWDYERQLKEENPDWANHGRKFDYGDQQFMKILDDFEHLLPKTHPFKSSPEEEILRQLLEYEQEQRLLRAGMKPNPSMTLEEQYLRQIMSAQKQKDGAKEEKQHTVHNGPIYPTEDHYLHQLMMLAQHQDAEEKLLHDREYHEIHEGPRFPSEEDLLHEFIQANQDDGKEEPRVDKHHEVYQGPIHPSEEDLLRQFILANEESDEPQMNEHHEVHQGPIHPSEEDVLRQFIIENQGLEQDEPEKHHEVPESTLVRFEPLFPQFKESLSTLKKSDEIAAEHFHPALHNRMYALDAKPYKISDTQVDPSDEEIYTPVLFDKELPSTSFPHAIKPVENYSPEWFDGMYPQIETEVSQPFKVLYGPEWFDKMYPQADTEVSQPSKDLHGQEWFDKMYPQADTEVSQPFKAVYGPEWFDKMYPQADTEASQSSKDLYDPEWFDKIYPQTDTEVSQPFKVLYGPEWFNKMYPQTEIEPLVTPNQAQQQHHPSNSSPDEYALHHFSSPEEEWEFYRYLFEQQQFQLVQDQHHYEQLQKHFKANIKFGV